MHKNELNLNENIEVIKDFPLEIKGDKLVNKLQLRNQELDVDGVFVMKDSASPKALVPGIETEGVHIKVNINKETNIPGCFACGDCAGKPYQYLKSAGQGQIAALNAVSYLDKKKIEERMKNK